jgi:hypothetical protein
MIAWVVVTIWTGLLLTVARWLSWRYRERRRVAQMWEEVRNARIVYCVGIWDIGGVTEVRGRSVSEVLARAHAVASRRLMERIAKQGVE